MKALSVRQPWAWAILHAGKDVENREWPAHYPPRRFRGRVLLHAAAGCTRREYSDAVAFIRALASDGPPIVVPSLADLPRGAIVGAVTIADAVEYSSSPWWTGAIALLLERAVALPEPITCSGALGYFNVPAYVAAQIRRRAA